MRSHSTCQCRYLVEAPPNICTPSHLAQAAAIIADSAKEVMELEVLDKEECEKLKMGCYLAVAACSQEPLKFIPLTYKPKGRFRRQTSKAQTLDA